jgi:hypothetical protein
MAVVVIGYAPNREMYEGVDAAMAAANGGEMPSLPGLIVHTASELADGRVQIVDVWESAEAEQHFVDNFLMPAFVKAGVPEEAMADGAPERTEPFIVIR